MKQTSAEIPTLKKGMGNVVRLIKASLLVTLAPVMVLTIYVIYNRLSLEEMFYGSIISFVLSLMFIYPYLSDLSALSYYVEQLAKDKKAKAPALSFLSNVEQLSFQVEKLNTSWEKRRLALEAILVESKILFDILPELLIMVNEDLQIVRSNNSASIIFQQSLQNHSLQEVIPDQMLINFCRWVLYDRKPKQLELFLPHPVNRYFTVFIERFPVQSPANIALMIVMHDITESKLSEQTFADFVANASHEIRTPLTSLIGMIETLRTTAKDDPEAQEMFLRVMAEQSQRMNRLVSDLLSLSKIEMHVNTLPTEKVNIIQVIHTVINHTEWFAKERNVVVEFIRKSEVLIITADSHQLNQLFANLIENAIKYGNANSTVRVEIELTDQFPKTYETLRKITHVVKIAVKDRGEGIAKEHIPRLTERFYRVDSARSRKNKIGGTGLGLAIVKQIIKRHQGELEIESTEGVGSTFTVYLPLAPESI